MFFFVGIPKANALLYFIDKLFKIHSNDNYQLICCYNYMQQRDNSYCVFFLVYFVFSIAYIIIFSFMFIMMNQLKNSYKTDSYIIYLK